MRRIAPRRQCVISTWLLCIIHSSWRRLTLLRPDRTCFRTSGAPWLQETASYIVILLDNVGLRLTQGKIAEA